jgi:hypothetical protein
MTTRAAAWSGRATRASPEGKYMLHEGGVEAHCVKI